MVGRFSKKLASLVGLLTSSILILCATCCDEDKPFASQILTFIIPTKTEPIDSILSIGDTLWIVTDTPDSLYEYHTKKRYKLANFDFGQTSIVIRKLINKSVSVSDQPSAASNFDLIVKVGEITFPGETYVEFKYEYDLSSEKYLLNIGLVPHKLGVFCINILSPSVLDYRGVIDLGRHENGASIIPVYEDIFFPMNEGRNNFELFKKHSLDESILNPDSYRNVNYIQKGTFTFRVVE